MKKLLAIALLLMVASSSLVGTMAVKRKLVGEEMHGNSLEEENNGEELSDENDNDHHRIPEKEYGRPGKYVVTDDSDHHRIPRRDYGTHPDQP
ncbi:hypothetical protein PIB30_118501 [Stylosanthes scabra]|uniref:Uncharacterized protein n=1 Tax=Stylosanthes scabra TaxID=79078 RepID=A0ABU6T7M3_9FABA|nr:hypothetical protein [Stylosanthes scabra]